MASKNDKRSASALDPLMAGFAGGAAAFIVYAMPQANFDDIVAMTGLPLILSAAQPPLGTTARLAVMIAAGAGSFLLVWLVLRALGKPAPKTKKRVRPTAIEMAPPRLRRADMHPDAPARRPILAGVDLGRSFDDPLLNDESGAPAGEAVAEESAPLEDFGDEVSPHDEFVDADDETIDDLPCFHDVVEPDETAEADQPTEQETGAGLAPDLSEEVEGEHAIPEPASVGDRQEVSSWQEPQEESVFAASPFALEGGGAQPDHLPVEKRGEVTIDELVQRLEAGLARRRPSRWSAPSAHVPNGNGHGAGSGSDQLDVRLRGAIHELQKLASRGN